MKALSPTSTPPEITTWEVMKQLAPMRAWWPMWLPLQRVTLSPTTTKGCTVLSSRMKQFSPGLKPGQTLALLLTYVARR